MTVPEEKVEQGMKKPEGSQTSDAPKHANYLLVFFALAILTGIEIAITQLPLPKAPILIPLALIKASLVALFYMHLRHDSRLFSMVFAAGIILAIGFIGSMVIMFGWHHPGNMGAMSMPPGMVMPDGSIMPGK